jgi:hypothetical protein
MLIYRLNVNSIGNMKMKKMSQLGIVTSPDSHQATRAVEKIRKKAFSVRASNPDMVDI